jgi:hypothetical protein
MLKKFDVWIKFEVDDMPTKLDEDYDREHVMYLFKEMVGDSPTLVVEDKDGTSKEFLRQIKLLIENKKR